MMKRRMKDSGIPWIGMIPEDWEVHCLRGISKGFKKGNGITKEDLITEGDTLCVRYGDLYTKYNQHIYDIKCRTNLSKITSPIYTGYGDILFACSGEDISLIGKSVAFMSYADCLVGGDLIIMKHEQNPRFLGYSLDSEMAQQQKSCGRSKLKVVHISVKDLKKIAIPIPPLSEQEAIASWLDEKCGEIDELIEVEQKMIEELEAYRQATITETVTRGLNPEAPMRQTGISWIPEIPQHWEIKSFKEYFSTCKGLSITKADLTENGIPVINYGQIHSKLNKGTGVTNEIIKFVPEFYIETDSKSLVNKGDFIFADTSEDVQGCGNCAYIDKDDKIFAGYHSIIAKAKKQPSKYLAYLFKTNVWRIQIHSQVNGIKVYSISQAMLGTTKLVIPPIAEQRAIADYLDTKCKEIDELIAVKREKIDTLKQYRQSIIFEAVTGKIQIN